MAEEKLICPACGSANTPSDVVCDICGEELSPSAIEAASAPEAASSAVDVTLADAPVNEGASSAKPAPVKKQSGKPGSARKKPAAKPAVRQQKGSSAALFSTTQWVAITVAAFILGGVVAASFIQGSETAPEAMQENAGMADQGSQIDLGRLNAAKAALDASPDAPAAILGYANALHDAMMIDQAIVEYKRYLLLNPDNPDAQVDLGICYFEMKDFSSAITEMEQAVAKHPDHQLGTYNLGIVNLNAGDKEKARDWFTRARDLDPNSSYGKNATALLNEHF